MSSFARPDDRDALLHELLELGRQTHAGLVLAAGDFTDAVLARIAARLERGRIEPTPERVVEMLLKTSGADLYLVVCCDGDVGGSWARFTQTYEPRLRKLALHLGCRDVDAVCADLFGDLSGPSPASFAETRLGTYLGAGTLFAWLGVILRRQLADSARKRPRAQFRLARTAPASPTDPLEQAMIDELADRLRDLLHVAWESLDDRERLVLLFKYREGLGQRTIATVMNLSESRISRIVSQAVTRIRSKMLARLESEQPGRFADPDRLWHALLHVVATHLSEAGPVEHDTQRGTRRG